MPHYAPIPDDLYPTDDEPAIEILGVTSLSDDHCLVRTLYEEKEFSRSPFGYVWCHLRGGEREQVVQPGGVTLMVTCRDFAGRMAELVADSLAWTHDKKNRPTPSPTQRACAS